MVPGPPERWAALFETVLWTAPVGIAVFDLELRYLLVNDRLAEWHGAPADEHVGRTPIDVLGRSGEPVAEALGRVLAGGMPVLDQPVAAAPASRTASYYPVRDAAGALFAIQAVVVETAGAADDRLTFLAEAGVALAGSLDLVEVLQRVAELAVPALADWCAVDVIRDDGAIEQVAIARLDERQAARATELRINKGLDPNAPIGVAAVLRGGPSELYPDVPDSLLQAYARDAEHLALLEALGMRSVIVVPLAARGRTFGAITLTTTDSDRRYGPNDLALAEDLARRAALAVDNANLYRESQEEARALEREIAARRRAETTARFLAEASTILASSLDLDRTVSEVARLTLAHLADVCAVDLVDDHGLRQVAVAHTDPELEAAITIARARWTDPGPSDHPAAQVLATGRSIVVGAPSTVTWSAPADDPDQKRLLDRLGITAVLLMPLTAGTQVVGIMALGRTGDGREFLPSDVELAEDLARRVGIAVDNARLYEERSRVARALQQSLLPPLLPEIPGVEIAARYRPTGAGNLVGGDFYDVFQDGDANWAVVVGDVAGIGAEAAAITGVARYTVRAVAMHEYRPSEVLRALNDAILRQRPDERFCTAVYLRLELQPDGARAVLSCGGHPPPLVLRADGRVEVVEAALGNLLGLFEDVHLSDAVVRLRPGDAVILYTDGVIEARRPDGSLFGQDRLVELVRRQTGTSAETMARRIESAVLADHPDRPTDDVAIVVLRVNG
jgi:serine phosphatase RsbU (regulator of sigma subunit)